MLSRTGCHMEKINDMFVQCTVVDKPEVFQAYRLLQEYLHHTITGTVPKKLEYGGTEEINVEDICT